MALDFYAVLSAATTKASIMPGRSNYLLPASSWARFNFPKPRIPDMQGGKVAADSGAFIAKGGTYPYTLQDYVKWLNSFKTLQWASTMDFLIDEQIAQNKNAIREQQQKTTANAIETWEKYQYCPWAWVPTIQGWQVEDYLYHFNQILPLIIEMKAFYSDREFRVGIGSLCKRADPKLIGQVLHELNKTLIPLKIPIHLWGIKLKTVKLIPLPNVQSVDSSAWDTAGMRKSGVEARDKRRALGVSKMTYAYKVLLPVYERKIQQASERQKQLKLF